MEISNMDLTIMIVYIIGIIIYGLWHAKRKNAEEYFLAGRSMTWPIIGISLFAANVSSTTLVGLAGDAYSKGISVYNYEWMAAVILIFFGIFILPFYLSSKVYTIPEFFEKRFDARSRYYFAFITLVGNVLIDMAAGLFTGALVLKMVFPEADTSLIIFLLALAAAAYTIPGGLSSVVQTETVQAVLLIIGSVVLTYYAYQEVGGWQNVLDGLNQMHSNGEIERSPQELLSLVGPIDDGIMPWTGLVFGIPILGFYFWVNNQFMVQRVLGAKNLNHGRWGLLFAGLLKIPVILIMVFPGTIAIILYPDIEKANEVYPTLLFNLLPSGVLGLVLAALLAAMSSSISATLNSASTLITMDFFRKINPNISSKNLVRIGQISTVVLVILAAAWVPQVAKFKTLWEYLQNILSYIAPPVVACFLFGIFSKKTTPTAAFTTLLVGFLCGISMIFSKIFDLSLWLNNLHFLHTGLLIFTISIIVLIVVSIFTKPAEEEKIKNIIWTKKAFDKDTEELRGVPWYKNFRVLSVILLLLIVVVISSIYMIN